MSDATKLETGDPYKDEVQNQWDQDPCGSQYVEKAQPDTLAWFLEVERYRYDTYAPWMREVMEFDYHAGEHILEIGAGIGTDHAQFAKAGGIMYDLDLSSGHLKLAQRNFELRGLTSTFRHGDGENIPFPDDMFDLVYSNGVIHHTPSTAKVINEIYRVLKPGGRCIIMVYAENSWHYWRHLFAGIGLAQGSLQSASMGEIMSRNVELSEHGSKPLVKVYTAGRLRNVFRDFEKISIVKRQLMPGELPRFLKWMPIGLAGKLMGWNLILKARKPNGPISVRHAPRAEAGASVAPPRIGFERALAAAETNFARWLEVRRGSKRLAIEEGVAFLGHLRLREPETVTAIIATAEMFLAHRFDLLGSGPFNPVDPDRPARGEYVPIDWFVDPVRHLRFPRDVPYEEWKLFEMQPGNADIKYPWELARSQHWVTLAQAWQLTRESRFAVEIARELDDFVEANPVGIGINWTCTMDVAIRAANWCLALALLHDCREIGVEWWHRAYATLYNHAEFVFANLENKHEVTSNHFLSNVVGLHILAAEFVGVEEGAHWDNWCRQALETEIDEQVHEEGADFESSVPYHRLVTELFMASARQARHQGRPLSARYEYKLARMVEFLLATTRPDGLMALIGDCDDGRFHIFTYIEGWKPQDARHLLAPAAALLNRPEWAALAGPSGVWEAVWWGYDPALVPAGDAAELPPLAQLFPEVGIAVARRGGNYLAITNGAVGTRGFGNHKHNDLLSFEYHCDGIPIIVDPGSFCYTSDFAARNLFRGTAYHNTIVVDGMEQNETNAEWIFRMFEKANPEHLGFAEDGDWVEYRGRHHGYERLERAVTHERSLRLNRATGLLLIEDRLGGAGEHEVKWHFHLAPGVEGKVSPGGVFELSTTQGPVLLTVEPTITGVVEDSWYSPSYGVRVPSRRLALGCLTAIDGTAVWRFAIGPAAAVEAWRGCKTSSQSIAGANA
jgi:ubiquinone/menaquinone biosynthesis C-methylase UbiE